MMRQQFKMDMKQPGLLDESLSNNILQQIHLKAGIVEKERKASVFNLRAKHFLAAASIIGLLVVGVSYWFGGDSKKVIAKTESKKKVLKNDVLPGGDKAVLTLADGSTIVLDEAQNGDLALQGNTKVIKLDGKLSYDLANPSPGEVVYNTITTPRGGKYQIELADGTMVWMNSSSSLRFPVAFAGKERRVEITGEAYFEVSRNKAMPFVVKVNSAEIQVLGTHFNVMAYNDEEELRTTLLEGSVNFVNGSDRQALRPGQQSRLDRNGKVKVLNDVDIDEVMAWKNGYFRFQDSDIETVIRQLVRWYDVEVVYKKKVDDLFVAEMPRNTKLSDALKALELTGRVRFEIEGRKIIVMP
jgi:ferric-dicitrate binding protein FerR (iron transport regulator)